MSPRVGSKFFTPTTMRLFGDTMRNYRVTGPAIIETSSGDTVTVWVLERKKAVKHGLTASAYFDVKTFARRWPKSAE